MAKVKMLKTVKGVKDNEIHPIDFIVGEIYELAGDLLKVFINIGASEVLEKTNEVKEKIVEIENKVVDYHNKEVKKIGKITKK